MIFDINYRPQKMPAFVNLNIAGRGYSTIAKDKVGSDLSYSHGVIFRGSPRRVSITPGVNEYNIGVSRHRREKASLLVTDYKSRRVRDDLGRPGIHMTWGFYFQFRRETIGAELTDWEGRILQNIEGLEQFMQKCATGTEMTQKDLDFFDSMMVPDNLGRQTSHTPSSKIQGLIERMTGGSGSSVPRPSP